MNLKPCPYRHADDEGHILCDKIKSGDRAVTPNICRVCPVARINCAHLRARLDHQARPPLTVRWGNGKSQVWDDFAQESISLASAACADKVIPIHAPRDCAGCALRKPVDSLQSPVASRVSADPSLRSGRPPTVAPRVVRRAPIAQPVAAVSRQPSAVAPDARSNLVAQKIIQLQEWLAKQNRAPRPTEEEPAPIAYAQQPRARVVGEEKRVGWTD
ncbi:MAG: hypothetical protein AB1817_10910 [Chloroflexota bacterium]